MRFLLGNFCLPSPHSCCRLTLWMAAIVGNGNTPTLDAVKPPDTLSLWIRFLFLGNTTLATHLRRRMFFRVVRYHGCDLPCEPCEQEEVQSIRTEECGHTSTAVQRNPTNYQQRLEAGKPGHWHPVAGHRGHRTHFHIRSDQ